jgi:hypothetical protein
MVLDSSQKYLDAESAFYLLNCERYLTINGQKRGTLGKTGPIAANYVACDMQQPGGENYAVQSYYSKETNELYSWVYNTNGVHYIQRINGSGECEVVYHGPCLQLSAEPANAITQFRAYLRVEKICANRDGKSLIWVNGLHEISMLDVEASIATENFTTPFFQRCVDECAPLRMCVPDPCGCLKGEFSPLDPTEIGLTNFLLDVGIKASYQFVYYDGRKSIWADPSTLYFQDTKGCFDTSTGYPRCIKFRVPIGNPLVEKINFAFNKGGDTWYIADTIDKYKKYNNTQQKWYERELSEAITGNNYSDGDCAFDYFFCNDKKCDTIDPLEFGRVFNPIPRSPQGFFTIEDSLAFYNYIAGNCPIDKKEIEKIRITPNCVNEESCDTAFATVKFYAVIHNRAHNRNQFIYRLGGDSSNSPDDLTETAYFGGLNLGLSGGFEVGYDQQFREETRNFIAYVEGTDYWDVGKQWKAHAFFTNKEEWGTIGNMDDVNTRNRWRRATRNGEFFYQQFEIKVPKGTKGFLRLSSHQSTGNDQDKSTFVIGIINDITVYKGDDDIDGHTDFTLEELYFDTCNGDVEILDAFVIDDNATDSGGENKSSAYYGYIVDKNNKPVEGAQIFVGVLQVSTTDHNGFYHFWQQPGENDAIDILVKVEQDCYTFSTIVTMSVQGSVGFNTPHDQTIDNQPYADGFYVNVNQKVQDCNGFGVAGIRVAISGSKYAVTGSDGIARFKIRNYSTRDREVRTVVMNNNGCFSRDCDGNCHPCMPTSTSATTSCYMGLPTVTMSAGTIDKSSALSNRYGLKSGGAYDFAAVVRFGCGKISAAYPISRINIPRTQEKGQDGFCTFGFNANGMALPQDATCFDIVRTANINPFELQWIVDEIERTADGKIKLTIQSLNDYNEKYLFKTNTIYQWLANDRVEFISNGDGSIFDIEEHGLLNYLTISPFNDEQVSGTDESPADFFNQLLINDDGKLSSLTKGAKIELQRAKECTTEPAYFSICVSIPVIDGVLAVTSGVFNTFDTYYVNRTIGNFPSQKFEHHSPSDFWGTRLTDVGRAYFENKFENEQRFGRNISLNAPNEFNYFGDRVKKLNPKSHGDIIAMWLVDDKIGLCISEIDNSLFQVSDDLLRVDRDGTVRAVGADNIISDTEPKISGTFGCGYDHIGGIEFGDGWVTWFDVKAGSLIKHDYQLAKPMDEGKCQEYFRRRAQEIETHNIVQSDPLNKYRIITGNNRHSGAQYMTIKRLRDNAIYNHKSSFQQGNDTIAFHPIAEDFLGMVSFVPEAYGGLDLFDGRGCMFITFFNGIPWVHPLIPTEFNKFFDVPVDRVIGFVINKFPEKEKVAIAMEIQDETMWFVHDVTTDKPGYRSEIPPIKVKKDGRKWNASFLGNINSRAGLYADERPRGEYVAVTLVRDNTQALAYNTVDNAKRVLYDEIDQIITKFSMPEQSGMTGNL